MKKYISMLFVFCMHYQICSMSNECSRLLKDLKIELRLDNATGEYRYKPVEGSFKGAPEGLDTRGSDNIFYTESIDLLEYCLDLLEDIAGEGRVVDIQKKIPINYEATQEQVDLVNKEIQEIINKNAELPFYIFFSKTYAYKLICQYHENKLKPDQDDPLLLEWHEWLNQQRSTAGTGAVANTMSKAINKNEAVNNEVQ